MEKGEDAQGWVGPLLVGLAGILSLAVLIHSSRASGEGGGSRGAGGGKKKGESSGMGLRSMMQQKQAQQAWQQQQQQQQQQKQKQEEWSDDDDDDGEGEALSKDHSKWERSKKLGKMGYYYAHHDTLSDNIQSHEYEMEKPKLLKKEGAGAGHKRPRPRVKITSYSWEDAGDTVKISFRDSAFPEGWAWASLTAAHVSTSWQPGSVSLTVQGSAAGPGWAEKDLGFDVDALFGAIGGAEVVLKKKRLELVLSKANRGGGAWSKLAK